METETPPVSDRTPSKGPAGGGPINAERLLALYDRVADAPDAVPRLRRFVLDLAVRGRLVEQQRIVAKVDGVMALCDRLEAGLAAADTARDRLLDSPLHETLGEAA